MNPLPLKRRLVLLSTILIALLLAAPMLQSGEAFAAQPPNIVLLFADDFGWTDLGCFGSRWYETPNIDRLAAEGVRFTSAYTNGPNCAPTRACMISGQYGPRHGIFTVGDPVRGKLSKRRMIPAKNNITLALEKITIAEALRDAGYVSAAVGKWHLGGNGNLPTDQGFDVNVGGTAAGSPAGGYYLPNRMNLPEAKKGEYLADHLTDRAMEFIEENRERPFFLYQSFHLVHTPIQSKKELQAHFAAKPTVDGCKHQDPAYAGMVKSLDENCGRILDTIERLGLTGRTVVFFMSDNGGMGGYADAGIGGKDVTNNAPLRGGKGMLYEGGVRVPMIVRWPDIVTPGTTSDVPVMTHDFYPTFVDIAGGKRPADYTLDGESLVQLLRGEKETLTRDALYWHFPAYLQGYGGTDRTTPAGAIRAGRYKLIEFFETGRIELYDLQEDIGERNNLAEKMPEVAERLHTQLKQWRKKVDAPMPRPNPDYQP